MSDQPPTWRFEIHDFLGIGSAVVAGIFTNIGQGFGMVSNEFYASARWRRLRKDHAEEAARNRLTFDQLIHSQTFQEDPDVHD